MRTVVIVCGLAGWVQSFAFAQAQPLKDLMNLMNTGDRSFAAGDFAAAAAVFRDAVDAAELSGDARLPLAINALANTEDELGRFSEAEHLYRRALAITAKSGVRNVPYALTLTNLGAHYLEAGQKQKAEPMLRDSVAVYIALGLEDSTSLALARNALANLVLTDGRFNEAETLIETSLATFRKHLDSGAAPQAVMLNNLGVVRRHQGRNQEAAELFEQSVRITETELGPSHPTLLRALNNLATVYAFLGRHDAADQAFRRSLEIAEKRLGASHPMYARVLLNYAEFLRESGQKAAAKTLAARANTVLRDNARTNGNGLTVDVSAFRH